MKDGREDWPFSTAESVYVSSKEPLQARISGVAVFEVLSTVYGEMVTSVGPVATSIVAVTWADDSQPRAF